MALQLGGVLTKMTSDGYGLRALIAQQSPKGVAAQLAGLVGQSSDRDERLAGVLMLYYEDHLDSAVVDLSLPDAAYQGLADKTVTEAFYIAELHRSHPPASRAAAEELVALAGSMDGRARRAAWGALGHAHTADELLEAVGRSSFSRDDWHPIAHAVAFCGTACGQGLVQLVSHPERGVRMAAYEAVGFAPEGEYEALVALATKHTPAGADAAELSARQALFIGDEVAQSAPRE